jgi:hypothetical protein
VDILEMKILSLRQLAILILWAGLACLVISAISNPFDLSMAGILEIDSENYDLFDQLESDDDFLLVTMFAAATANLLLSKAGAMSLYFRIAHLSPLSPPPKAHLS